MARKRTGKRIEVDGGYRVAGKAANGEGTVFYDKSINAWRVRWVDINGRPRTTSGPTRKAARARRAERDAGIVAAKNVGTALGDDPTVADLATHWLESFSATIGPGTHTGRRTFISLLYQAGVPLEDIARFVGHADVATTAGYVVDLGERPARVAARAAELFDAGQSSSTA